LIDELKITIVTYFPIMHWASPLSFLPLYIIIHFILKMFLVLQMKLI